MRGAKNEDADGGGTAQWITSRGADYVLTVKGNQPTLKAKLKALPRGRRPRRVWRGLLSWAAGAAHHQSSTSTQVGRVPRRRPSTTGAPHPHQQ